MLQQIRDGLKGPVIIGVILLIIGVPFAFSGIQGYLQNSVDPVVATVGKTKITQAQLRNAYDQRYRQLQQLLGENFRADQIQPGLLREAVLKDMVQESLLRKQAHDGGFRAGDAALRDYLATDPSFQENGKFSAQRYRSLLASSRQTVDRYEASLRERLVVEQLREAVLGSSFVTADEAIAAARLAHQQREFAYLKFEPAKYLSTATVSDEQVKQRYEERQADFQAPERIKLSYVELALEQLPKVEPPGADILKTLYEAEKTARFSSPEIRRASHILINFGADKSASKGKAESLYTQIKGGADFKALAAANSDDTGSKGKGGELGEIKRGDSVFPAAFEAALFALTKAGDVSEPVETEFGWHLIKLDELQPARTQAFEEAPVQQTLLDLYQRTDAQKRFQEMSEKLETQAFENAASLDPVAKALDLKVQTADWSTRAGGAGLTANVAVIAAAFSKEVLTDGENSKPIALDPEHLVVIRKADYEAPHQRTLAEVEPAIRDTLKTEQAKEKAQADAAAALKSLHEGQALMAVAKASGQTVQTPAAVKRDSSEVSRPLLNALFKLPHPQADSPSLGQATLENGDIAVIALTAVKDALSSTEDLQREVATLRDARAGSEFAAYRDAIQKRISVDLKPLPKDESPAP